MAIPPSDIRDRVDVLTSFAKDALERGEHMFYVRIPAPLEPMERANRFEDPLNEALSVAGLGEVAGGGSQLGEGDTIVYCGLDVFVSNRDIGLQIIRDVLRRLGAPEGTKIEEFLPVWSEFPL